jgi:hypothetical protein
MEQHGEAAYGGSFMAAKSGGEDEGIYVGSWEKRCEGRRRRQEQDVEEKRAGCRGEDAVDGQSPPIVG